ncbi:MAG: tRNA (adenosine(37)-N6)-threonylcarbamoyltransferase complex ATPase subunit type 1 TsaE [Actinomycetota bacterium]
MRIEIHSATAQDTREVGEALASLLHEGDAIALTGELGAGKTTFVQGLARGLQIDDPIVSPTFTLIREYRGRLHLVHVDVYRLERVQDVIDLGLDDEVSDGALLVVEWGDAVQALLPPDHLTIEMTVPTTDVERRLIVLSGDGPSWHARWERLESALVRWASGSAA